MEFVDIGLSNEISRYTITIKKVYNSKVIRLDYMNNFLFIIVFYIFIFFTIFIIIK